tara:strand:+ start:4455 stop:5684 length:1230 start_codon:yes stop_codon:yes gene_type:complete
MANNALIQGAARTGKKFLDVGAEVGKGLMLGAAANLMNQTPPRAKANEAIQQKVNGYMSKMKTDMDFTSFTPAETKSMRGFLLKERGKYTDAAKRAAQFKDTTSPEYLAEVDIMQSVNNSFTNLSSQLGSYKKGKVDYASAMQQGLYSKGNDPDRSRESMIAYGFYDGDGDGRSDSRYDSPFQIQEGGNIGFKVDGNVIDYSDMAEPFVKDTKFLNSLNSTSENAYNNGAAGKNDNQYAQDSYDQSLDSALQNEDTLNSIIYDFKSEVKLDDVGLKLDNGTYTIEQAREEVKSRLLVARNQAFKDGKKEYDREQAKVNAPKQTSSQIAASKKITKKLELLDNGQQITAMTGSTLRTAKLAPWADAGGEGSIYYMTDDAGLPIEEKIDGKYKEKTFTRDEVVDKLNLYNK